MKRVEKYGDMLIRGLTLPVRIVVGIVNATFNHKPLAAAFSSLVVRYLWIIA